LIPTTGTSPLSPVSGASFRVWAGFRWPAHLVPAGGRNPELVACGRFDVEDVDIDYTPGGVQVRLAGQDLTGRLAAARVPKPVSINAGTNAVDAAKYLVTATIPEMQFDVVPSGATTPWVILDEQANILDELHKLLSAIGYEAFMAPDGESLHMRPIITTGDQSSWQLAPGQFTLLTRATNQLSRERVYNGVIAKGETVNSDDPPVRAEVWDDDPSSPTYYVPNLLPSTRIGPRPYWMVSQYIRTQEQADNAARSQLVKVKGLLQRVAAETIVNPALSAGDVIDYDVDTIGVAGRYVVERVSWSYPGSVMQLSCEERRV
jgi:hypothetical protein